MMLLVVFQIRVQVEDEMMGFCVCVGEKEREEREDSAVFREGYVAEGERILLIGNCFRRANRNAVVR